MMCVWALLLLASAALAQACEPSSETDDVSRRLCALETQMRVLENAMQEVLQRTDITIEGEPANVEKRKNEFIRFGKRSEVDKRKNEFIRFGKRKNEFIRFGKRKNEFIRFGRSDPALIEDASAFEKRKNEFIRFG